MGQYNGHSKPMVQVAGKPLIGYAIEAMMFCGVSTIHVIFSEYSKDIVTLRSQYKEQPLSFIYQENVTGSLSSLSFALSVVEPPLIMMDADIIIHPSVLKHALDNYVYQGEDMAIAAVTSPTFFNKNTLHIRDGCPVDFCGKGFAGPNTEHDTFCQGGMVYLWFRSPRAELVKLERDGMSRMSLFLSSYMKTHQVSTFAIQDLWDVDTPEDICASVEILRGDPDH